MVLKLTSRVKYSEVNQPFLLARQFLNRIHWISDIVLYILLYWLIYVHRVLLLTRDYFDLRVVFLR